jgi:hypothetical protein
MTYATEEQRVAAAKASKAKWQAKNRDHIIEYCRKRYAKKAEELRKKCRDYYAANKDQILERNRQRNAANSVARYAQTKDWRKANPDKYAAQQKAQRTRNLANVTKGVAADNLGIKAALIPDSMYHAYRQYLLNKRALKELTK